MADDDLLYATADDYLRTNGRWAIKTAPNTTISVRLPFFSHTLIVFAERQPPAVIIVEAHEMEIFDTNPKGAAQYLESLNRRFSFSSTTWRNMGLFHTAAARMAWIQRKFPEFHIIWERSARMTQANLCATWGHLVEAVKNHKNFTANNPSGTLLECLLNPSVSQLRQPNKKLHCEKHGDDAVTEDPTRQSWTESSHCEIYSQSEAKWCKGQIIDVRTEADGRDWLTVVFGSRITRMMRFHPHIRPIDFGPEYRELLVFGFVRSLERSGSRAIDRHIKELCYQFYESERPTFEENNRWI